jgi:hypothetical protein
MAFSANEPSREQDCPKAPIQSATSARDQRALAMYDDQRNRAQLGVVQGRYCCWNRGENHLRAAGGTMTNNIILSRQQARDIFKAINGIGQLLKALPAGTENVAVLYAIMSNLAVIQASLVGLPRVSSN